MDFEPQKFFIGVVDFFSILLPGAVLTYLLKDDVGPRFLGKHEYGNLSGTAGWLAFLFSSYLLGHLIFLLGSWLLAEGRNPSPAWARWLARLFFKKDVDRTVRQAVRIKEYHLDPLRASSAINAFQWSKARLTLDHPEAMTAVQRFEADSKFFRSLFIVLWILIPWALIKGRPAIPLFMLPVIAFVFWRFEDQRLKATNQAYWYVITLEANDDASASAPIDG